MQMVYHYQVLLLTLLCLCTLTQTLDNEYRFTISIDPKNGIDNSSLCYPPETGGLSSIPCQSLNFALLFHYRSSIKFYFTSPSGTYKIADSPAMRFTNENDVAFYGNDSFYPLLPTVKCDPQINTSTGLSFLNSSSVIIYGLQFLFCGTLQNSTSRNFAPGDQLVKLLQIRVSLYFYNCTNIEMHKVVVANSTEALGVALYDNDGIVNITACQFANNEVNNNRRFPGGGAIAVEFPYCKPGDDTCNDTTYDPFYRRNKNSIYSFTFSTFSNNHAHGQYVTDYGGKLSLASNSSHQAVGRGGAISMYVKGDASNNSISIVSCQFIDNTAVWGGALHIEMDDHTTKNSVYISDCEFVGNQAYHDKDYGTGGGAILIAITMHFWDESINVTQSRVHINNTSFVNNHAIEGGGLSFAISRLNKVFQNDLTELLVSSCRFESNKARIGSAVIIFDYPITNDGLLPPVTIEDCNFTDNSIVFLNEAVHPLGNGAVYVNDVALQLQGNVAFINNSGSALSIVGAKVGFDDHSSISFINNRGVRGGGIALLGGSFLLIGENTSVIFINNHASQYGGAIYNEYSSRQDLKSSIDCFIRYEKPFIGPKEWAVQFYFLNNKANKLGQSIYSTAILPCLYGDSDVTKIFCWTDEHSNEHWIYEGSNCSDQIHTEPQQFSLWYSDNISLPITAYPGQTFRLPLNAWDDLSHNVTNNSVYYAYMEESIISAEVKPGYTYVASNYIRVTGEPRDNLTLVMQTEGSRTIHVSLNLTLETCPPGFDQGYDHNIKKKECRCSNNDYRGHIRCLAEDLKSQIDTKYWFGLVEVGSTKQYLMGYIPLYFVSNVHRINSSKSFVDLPGNLSQVDEFLCGHLNRRGILCGECLPDYAVAINSPNYECVSCNDTTITKSAGYFVAYILLTYGPITILFLIIVLCNFNLVSSATSGIVLFAQIISSEFFDITAYQLSYLGVGGASKLFQNVYIAIYGIFNLRSFSLLMEPFCLIKSPSFNILSVLCLDYAIAFYPLLVIFGVHLFFYCHSRVDTNRSLPCRKCQQPSQKNDDKKTKQNRWVNAFVAFMILSYSKFGLSSMKTLLFNNLFNAAGEIQDRRVYLAGQLSYFAHNYYLAYAIPALIIAAVFMSCPPLVLLVTPLMNRFADKSRHIRKIWRGDVIHIYLNVFEGYKDNRRWFSSVYLIFRLSVFIIYAVASTIFLQYVLQQIAIIIVIVLVAMLKPYEVDLYNYWDIVLLSNLGILNILGTFMFVNGFSSVFFGIEGFLVLAPLVTFISGYFLRKLYHYCSKMEKLNLNRPLVRQLIELVEYTEHIPAKRHQSRSRTMSGNGEDSLMDEDDTNLLQRAEEENLYRCASPTNNIETSADPETLPTY